MKCIRIPWWYKLFIKYMPTFYEQLPKEAKGLFTVHVDIHYGSGKIYKYVRYGYSSTQKAYLHARWITFWKAFFVNDSQSEIHWKIINEDI